MRISDWSSDVFSSDLCRLILLFRCSSRFSSCHLFSDAFCFSGLASLHRRRQFLNVSTSSSAMRRRSEEHTSELKSLMRSSYAVFCLITKKYNTKPPTSYNTFTSSEIIHYTSNTHTDKC